jgi:hypothetical protein
LKKVKVVILEGDFKYYWKMIEMIPTRRLKSIGGKFGTIK